LIRAGYRRFWKACQPIDHSITGDAAMATKRLHQYNNLW
jgi:hypothetical protein